MATALSAAEQGQALAALLGAARISLDELWLDYFALGGAADVVEVEAYLADLMPLPALQRDLLASAVNERLDRSAVPGRAPYSRPVREPLPEHGPLPALVNLLEGAKQAAPDRLPALAAAAGRLLGVQLLVYLADYQQRELIPLLPEGEPARDRLGIDSTLAGRAFRLQHAIDSSEGVCRLWIPLLDGTERLGVLDVMLSDQLDLADPLLRQQCQWVADLLGHLITIMNDHGDALDSVRRVQARTVGSELVWALLPPLTAATATCTISGRVEPSYAVGGDTFDYSLSDTTATFAIFDAMGHGLSAGLLSAAALAASRAGRRNGLGLFDRAMAIDSAIVNQGHGEAFVTGILAELDLITGRLRYLAAGHPELLLLRDGRVTGALTGGRRLPFGLGTGEQAIAETRLQPDDRLALYTDGITEARDSAGQFFGQNRLTDFLEREGAADQPAPETLRRLIHAVLAHQNDVLQDDATIVLAHWHPASGST